MNHQSAEGMNHHVEAMDHHVEQRTHTSILFEKTKYEEWPKATPRDRRRHPLEPMALAANCYGQMALWGASTLEPNAMRGGGQRHAPRRTMGQNEPPLEPNGCCGRSKNGYWGGCGGRGPTRKLNQIRERARNACFQTSIFTNLFSNFEERENKSKHQKPNPEPENPEKKRPQTEHRTSYKDNQSNYTRKRVTQT